MGRPTRNHEPRARDLPHIAVATADWRAATALRRPTWQHRGHERALAERSRGVVSEVLFAQQGGPAVRIRRRALLIVSVQATIFRELVVARDRLVIAFGDIAEKALAGSVGELARAEQFFGRASTAIGAQVNAVLPHDWSCRVSASFVHGGRPAGRGDDRYMVIPVGKKRGCEVGDLLVAVEHLLPNGSARTALLVQAKKGTARPDEPWRGDASGKKQRALFGELPIFTWREPLVYVDADPPERTLAPEDPVECYCGAHFRLWGDSHWSRWPRDGDPHHHGGAVFATLLDTPLVVPPAPGHHPRPLAAVLADMILLTGGWEFRRFDDAFAPTADPRGWSAVVWELLLRSAVNEHRRAGTSGVSTVWEPDRDQVLFEDEERLELPFREMDGSGRGAISVVRVRIDGRDWSPQQPDIGRRR
jgi:hypothetical protein